MVCANPFSPGGGARPGCDLRPCRCPLDRPKMRAVAEPCSTGRECRAGSQVAEPCSTGPAR